MCFLAWPPCSPLAQGQNVEYVGDSEVQSSSRGAVPDEEGKSGGR